MFHGSITALVTPFRSGEIDWKAFDNMVEWQIEQGTHGVVPCGTTGESPTLSDDEIKSIIKRCIEVVKGRIPVIAGTGSNSTRKSVAMTQAAQELGANAALIVAPYYNKPTQDGLFAHYKTIHDSSTLPIVLYNVPGRCVAEIAIDTVLRLAELPRIVGLKDAVTDTSRCTIIKARAKGDFCVLSGEDALAGAFLAQGASGCISVTSNIAPAECAAFQNAWAARDLDTFSALQARLAPLHKALFTETSPSPVKYAASQLGLCSDEVRLPLVPASESCRAALDKAMKSAGLITGAEAGKLRRHG
jgi:4-hydroxy-tetrahydrodipicolinate synthase